MSKTKPKDDLPLYVIRVEYDEKSLSVKKKREGVKAVTRYMYLYPHDDLNERMSSAWKPGAKAVVYRASYEPDGVVKASEVKGIWQ